MSMDKKTIFRLAESGQAYAVEARRWMHMHAELSNQEFETTEYIVRQLEEMGIPYVRPAKTGVIGILRGTKPGRARTLGIRADIDALPIQEVSDQPYCSRNPGVMHACGHDAHGAGLLAAARLLQGIRDQFCGTVRLIFQPAEEYFPSGARAMMAAGDLDDCDAIIGVHVFSHIPLGKICVAPGSRMAASASVNIRVKGRGGHGGMPHQAVDAIVAAAAIIMNLQTLPSRELNLLHSSVVSIGTLQAGTAKNIIAEEAYMTGTLRYFDNDLIETLEPAIRRIAINTAAAFRAEAEVEIVPGLPAAVNDETLAALAGQVCTELFGGDALFVPEPEPGVDDFAYYAEKAPTLYAFIGARNEEKLPCYPHHNPRFDIDEACMKQSVEFFAGFTLNFLKG